MQPSQCTPIMLVTLVIPAVVAGGATKQVSENDVGKQASRCLERSHGTHLVPDFFSFIIELHRLFL